MRAGRITRVVRNGMGMGDYAAERSAGIFASQSTWRRLDDAEAGERRT